MLRDVRPGNVRDFEFEFELLGNSWQVMANQAKRAGRLGVCTFLELFLNFDSFPFSSFILPSRTPKGYTLYRVLRERKPLGKPRYTKTIEGIIK